MRRTLLLGALVHASVAIAQRPSPDSLRAPLLDAVVVTAERASGSISTSVSAVTRLSAAELARTPRATLADVLRLAPGFAVVDFDGLGFDPQLMVRGFYGGGEAEYVVVLVDGKPVSQLQTGLVAWDVLPAIASIEAVEVVRGDASSLYGDAAIGGVINIITRAGGSADASNVRWEASAGTAGTVRASTAIVAPGGWQNLSLSGAVDRTSGYRDHARRSASRAAATYTIANSVDARLALTTRLHWRDFQEPGPLLESLLASDRKGFDPLFRFDRTTDESGGVTLDGGRRVTDHTRLSASLGGERRTLSAMRTLALAPGFGDTKRRRATTDRLAASAQLETADSPLPGADRFVFGVEANRGRIESRYHEVLSGTRDDYESASGAVGNLDTHGESVRSGGAVFAQYTLQASDAIRLSLGGRLDRLHDTFDPRTPADDDDASTTHSAFSPKGGINFRYLEGDGSSGNLYVAIGRSFKSPTLDQLYDQRNIPVPFPPYAIRTSNPDLHPQHGTSLEAGVYHGAPISSTVRVAASLNAYQVEMKDELDFDVATFRYVNIGRSRHRGVEAGARLEGAVSSAFANYTLQAATSRSGDFAGKRLKAIPRHSVTSGVSLTTGEVVETSLIATHVRGMHLDDANTVSLPNYTRVDARVAVRVARIDVFADVRNLLGARFSTSGFPDPGGSGEAYLYPAAGRVLEVGVRRGR